MQRRDFTQQMALAGLALAVSGTARAQRAPVEGTHYVKVSPPAPVTLPTPDKKVEVVEFFSYSCPHCYQFEPVLDAWVKRLPADVAFRQVPVGFMAQHQLLQRLHYALEDIGQLGAMHRKVFNAIHQQGKRLASEAEIVAFVSANGVDGAKFQAAFKSFSVANKANRAKQLQEAYKIDGVPALGIQGRYYTSASLAGNSHEGATIVADALIRMARPKG